MFERSTANIIVESKLAGGEAEVVYKIVDACRQHQFDTADHCCTEHYIHTGALAWQFVCFRLQDGVTRPVAVQDLKDRLTKNGVANTDVSTFIKSFLLHELCPAVMDLPVSVLIALLPLCRAKDEMPQFVVGVSLYRVTQLVLQIQVNRIAAAKVRVLVASILGRTEKVKRTECEKVGSFLDKIDDWMLLQALCASSGLRRRLGALLAKAEALKKGTCAVPADGEI